MAEVVKSLGEWGEWVIIDTPPLLAVADPAAVARWSDGVLLVTQAAVSTRDAGRKAMELLEKVGARTIGVVVWGLEESRAGGYGYGYYASGYYYANYYAQPSGEFQGKQKRSKPAGEPDAVTPEAPWTPKESDGRRFGRMLGAFLKGLLAFILVVVVLLGVLLAASHYMGWGLAGSLHLPAGLRF